MTPHSATAVRRVAVIGAGTIGASWTAWFLSRGLEVVASDPAPGAGPDPARRRDAALARLLAARGTATLAG
jgi:3-hydroxyacyl-CoA dehydrogenase